MRALLVLALLAACGDNDSAPPDAFEEGFGNDCTSEFSPTGPCESTAGVIGWCIVGDTPPHGICRRACNGERECPAGHTEMPIPIMPNDCYCMP